MSTPVQVQVKDRIPKPVEAVFNAIIDPSKMSGYFASDVSAPITEGKVITWQFEDAGAKVDIQVKSVKQNEFISFEWQASGVNAIVEMTFESINAELTAVKIIEKEWPMDEQGVKRALGQTQGWTDFLCCLKAYLLTGINLRTGRKK